MCVCTCVHVAHLLLMFTDACSNKIFDIFLHCALHPGVLGASGGDSPAARRSCCLDGVDSQAVGDVPQRLHCLLVWFVVILHEGKMSSSSAPQKWTKGDPSVEVWCAGSVCVCV